MIYDVQAVLISMQNQEFSSISELASVLVSQTPWPGYSNPILLTVGLINKTQVFVGTPHRASQFDSWDRIAAKLIFMGPHAVSCDISDVAKKAAPVLRETSQQFMNICTLYSFISFHDLSHSPDMIVGLCTAISPRLPAQAQLTPYSTIVILSGYCHYWIAQ